MKKLAAVFSRIKNSHHARVPGVQISRAAACTLGSSGPLGEGFPVASQQVGASSRQRTRGHVSFVN